MPDDVRVALRKESVDRNYMGVTVLGIQHKVALRKESVDRNPPMCFIKQMPLTSLSARRAWIEIVITAMTSQISVSLSARRAWIEIHEGAHRLAHAPVALRKESVDRNDDMSGATGRILVALRKESVDRNSCWLLA